MASGLKSISEACLLIASSACFRSVMSRNTRTTPVVLPSLSLIGAPLSSIGNSEPSLRNRIVWLAKPTIKPSSSTFATGSSTSRRVCSLTMLNACFTGFWETSLRVQPVSSSATPFMKVILPSISVAITASPMLDRVVDHRCSVTRKAVSASLRAATSFSRSALQVVTVFKLAVI